MNLGIDPVLGAIIVAIITAIVSPLLVQWYQNKRANHPQNGWKAAVETQKQRIDSLEKRVAEQEGEITTLTLELRQSQDANHSKDMIIADKDRIIGQQSRALVARDARLTQLARVWPNGVPFPSPDPAYANDL